MNDFEKEWSKKYKQEIKDLIKTVKLAREIVRKNDKHLKEQLGIQSSLNEFYKPVIGKINQGWKNPGFFGFNWSFLCLTGFFWV